MKTSRRLLTASAFQLVGLAPLLAACLTARTYSVLHSFDYANGGYPAASLIQSSNTLFGTTRTGGLGGGIVFKINLDGSGFTNLHSFAQKPPLWNDDGFPFAGGLVLSASILYGTTIGNASGDNGTVFSINIDGTGFTNLYLFSQAAVTNIDGAHPYAGLALSGNKLYGTTAWGGNSGNGTVFSLNVDGSGFEVLYSFTGGKDGANPKGALTIQSNILYGTTENGGNGTGTIFAIDLNGMVFKTIYSFSYTGQVTNLDGEFPWPALLVSKDTIYGVTTDGGGTGYGTLFKLGIDGSNFTLLHTFRGTCVNSTCDGQLPAGSLILYNDTLYGTTMYAGASGNGIVYSIKVDGTHFDSLYNIPNPANLTNLYNPYGEVPFCGVILISNLLYGTTEFGGDYNYGILFSLSLDPPALPQLTAKFTNDYYGPGILLSWPTNVPGFPPISIETSSNLPFTLHTRAPMRTFTNNDGRVVGSYPIKSQSEYLRIFQHW
jgi:uncharacterized repeat protein (TIGR03803 family)